MEVGLTVAMALVEAERNHADNRDARRLAPKLSTRAVFCIEYMHKIAGIEIADMNKDANGDDVATVNVYISGDGGPSRGSADGSTAPALDFAKTNRESSATSHQFQRTLKHFKEFVRIVTHWANKHATNIKPCAYCREFKHTRLPNRLARATMSKGRLGLVLQDQLNAFVSLARRPCPSKIECQGFDHIPSVITTSLNGNPSPADASGGAAVVITEAAVVVAAVAVPGDNDDLAEEKHQ